MVGTSHPGPRLRRLDDRFPVLPPAVSVDPGSGRPRLRYGNTLRRGCSVTSPPSRCTTSSPRRCCTRRATRAARSTRWPTIASSPSDQPRIGRRSPEDYFAEVASEESWCPGVPMDPDRSGAVEAGALPRLPGCPPGTARAGRTVVSHRTQVGCCLQMRRLSSR